jgi:hypothetical protein
VKQSEFDFGPARQARIGRALRASPAVSRAVPLADTDKLLLACMEAVAKQIADETLQMSDTAAKRHIAARVTRFVGSLNGVSNDFALETTRYINDTIRRLQTK